jgi:hypothetical protein
MNARAPFWPLLKHELEVGWFGGLARLVGFLSTYWLFLGVLPYVFLYAPAAAHANLASLFEAGFVPIMLFLMGISLSAMMIYATVPAFCDLVEPTGSASGSMHLPILEFLFTRAINRRLLFRARATVFFILVLTPLFINLALSPLAPPTSFGLAESTSPAAVRRYEHYRRAFPASRPATNPALVLPGQITIPHGAVAFTAWLAWVGALCFVLLQAYGVLIAKRVKPNQWRTVPLAAAPLLALLLCFFILTRTPINARLDICERSFLFFSTYPVPLVMALAALALVLQVWCERRFSKLEIL